MKYHQISPLERLVNKEWHSKYREGAKQPKAPTSAATTLLDKLPTASCPFSSVSSKSKLLLFLCMFAFLDHYRNHLRYCLSIDSLLCRLLLKWLSSYSIFLTFFVLLLSKLLLALSFLLASLGEAVAIQS